MCLESIEKSQDGTIKLNYSHGYSAVIISLKEGKKALCLSSQIGCVMGCKFCLSGKSKFERNLGCDEILEQFFDALEYLNGSNVMSSNNSNGDVYAKEIITSIVFMGMGEPLHNLKNVIGAIESLHYDYFYPMNKITVSTCGVISKMREVIEHPLKIQLALSLHSGFQDRRDLVMPSLKSVSVDSLVEVVKEYNEIYRQKMMIEYLMIDGFSDRDVDLRRLIDFDFGDFTNFNLIELSVPFELNGKRFVSSNMKRCEEFQQELIDAGYKCFVRESLGKDISAACGMIRKN